MRAAQAFVQVEASSGIVLLVAAIVALVWANSPWDQRYFDLVHTHLSIDLSLISIEEDFQHWVNDALMTVFFFLVGLEIKRELVHGELSDARRALLPAAAALGGMIGPALIYTAFNYGGPGSGGWGIPMATDIAFALGVLSLLSGRIPFSIKVFLLALAIADDIGAILVIAVFYTSAIDFAALAVAALILGVIIVMNRGGVRNVDIYVVAGVLLWLAVYESGIHATLAGVTLGLLAPATAYFSPKTFSASADDLVGRYRDALDRGATDEQQGLLAQIEDLSQGTESPLDRLERKLHPWVSYAIVPLFALVNAGVPIAGDVASRTVESPISLGVAVGLLLGKPAGILLLTWLTVRLRLGDLPAGADWGHMAGVGLLGGIGFTVSLLITGLAFEDALLVDEAKLGVLGASLIAGVMGFAFLWFVSRRSPAAEGE
jgi:Na+:H+ antiporter, NhaA family